VATEAVRAEMTRQGVTQEAIATRLGLRRQNVSTRLAGIVAWSPEQLATVADLLTVPVTRLLHNGQRGRTEAVPRGDALTGC
jgi:transcriptional regulator with XRE-family HTH domain